MCSWQQMVWRNAECIYETCFPFDLGTLKRLSKFQLDDKIFVVSKNIHRCLYFIAKKTWTQVRFVINKLWVRHRQWFNFNAFQRHNITYFYHFSLVNQQLIVFKQSHLFQMIYKQGLYSLYFLWKQENRGNLDTYKVL